MRARVFGNLFKGLNPRALAGGVSRKKREEYARRNSLAFPVHRPPSEGEKPAREKFLSRKKAYCTGLKPFLGDLGVEPEVQKAILRVGRLPFAYAWMSHGPALRPPDEKRVSGFSFADPVSRQDARSLEKIVFSPAYFVVHLDPTHPHSAKFLSGLRQLVKRIGSARMFQEGKNTHQILCPHKDGLSSFEIAPGEVDRRVAQSRNFVREFDDFVRGFPKSVKR